MERRPDKVREQAALPCGERTSQAESIAQAKAPHRKCCPGVSKKHKETSMAGALVSMGDIGCELGTITMRSRLLAASVPTQERPQVKPLHQGHPVQSGLKGTQFFL